uniref:Uncharacterized protein n=1 Tax=Rousettus aegyptiacus TaxID=9407 RepID=A0A7J8E8E4_ROUAE|nr:hypothetical protein HJG63_008225 [Rousettus aegyptiacus]
MSAAPSDPCWENWLRKDSGQWDEAWPRSPRHLCFLGNGPSRFSSLLLHSLYMYIYLLGIIILQNISVHMSYLIYIPLSRRHVISSPLATVPIFPTYLRCFSKVTSLLGKEIVKRGASNGEYCFNELNSHTPNYHTS